MSELLHHYVIVRKDLPKGVMAAMIIHASGGSALRPLPDDTHAYALEVDDEAELLSRAERLRNAGCPHIVVVEPDAPYHGQAMAIGVIPTPDKDRIRRVLSDVRLVR